MKTPVLAAAVFLSPNAAAATQVGSNGYFVGMPHEQEELWQGDKQIRERSVYQQSTATAGPFSFTRIPTVTNIGRSCRQIGGMRLADGISIIARRRCRQPAIIAARA